MDEEDWDADISDTTTTVKPVFTPTLQPATSTFGSSGFGVSTGRGRGSLLRPTDRQETKQETERPSFGHENNRSNDRPYRQEHDRFRSENERPYRSENDRSYKQDDRSYNKPAYNQYDNNNNNNKNYSSITEILNIETKSISSIIGKAGATINNIKDTCGVKVIIPAREEIQNQSHTDIKIIGQSKENIDKAIQMIKESSSYMPFNRPDHTRNRSNSTQRYHPYSDDTRSKGFGSNEQKPEVKKDESITINWDLIRSQPLQNMNKFKDHPPVVKDFYEEDPEITAMTRDEVIEFRKTNFNIMVELFKKDSLNFGLASSKKDEDTRTPEEIQDYLFSIIPKPVKTIEQAFKKYPGILEECKRQQFLKPTPIQSQLWPILLKGVDCVGIAQTGTGKTLAFLLPALVHIDNQITPRDKRIGPNCLVLSPTRELAIQIEQEVKKINYKGIKSVCGK